MKYILSALSLLTFASLAQARTHHYRPRVSPGLCQATFGTWEDAKATCGAAGYGVTRMSDLYFRRDGYICSCGTFDPSAPGPSGF